MSAAPDLHALANTPGAGKAEKALRKAGAWDDLALAERRKWSVQVEVTIRVEARDESEAMEFAEEMAESSFDGLVLATRANEVKK